MRNYFIYLLKDDVAYEYFGKEFLIFNLFLEQIQEQNPARSELLSKQIDYITNPISVIEINRYIEKNMQIQATYKEKGTEFIYKPQASKSFSLAKLEVYDRYMRIMSEGSYDAETHFFEVLRKYNPCFLAMDFDNKHFGWLNPIKQERYI
ncbi:sporulation inhibitor of replication protein SirA [Calidifontibacillus erzurumensis]|uniref:Sporulation inhibitor of replication protein SirA n=1 Tax=Calidifontibacillus erzurumensis TaxID=2741433 RepID=A0A8J8GET0_9BACI|nr:sporulation inhibitor of replication protein SirA [Calidifontibacillus erzurumensis]NSL51093.1 sporulation inhibitor of replication protein SirA [Calidifontibacillus erzurumensis]